MGVISLTLADRRNDLLIRHIDLLRNSVANVKLKHPFEINAMVVLPDHLHAIWTLPENDYDYSKRWTLIKSYFSRQLPKEEYITKSRYQKGERGIWQRRFWEHLIRDEEDYKNHVEYIHNNPVKHGYVNDAKNWPHSSIHKFA